MKTPRAGIYYSISSQFGMEEGGTSKKLNASLQAYNLSIQTDRSDWIETDRFELGFDLLQICSKGLFIMYEGLSMKKVCIGHWSLQQDTPAYKNLHRSHLYRGFRIQDLVLDKFQSSLDDLSQVARDGYISGLSLCKSFCRATFLEGRYLFII